MTRARHLEQAVVPLPGDVVRERLAPLRRLTAPHHLAVERRVDLERRLDSADTYTDLLARLYGFYQPFESALDDAITRWGLPVDLDARRKVPLLVRDLSTLGLSVAEIDGLPRCDRLPRPTSPAGTLGCLYVVEGATLGGRIIARRVDDRLGFASSSGASFFGGYGADTGPRWQLLCSLLAAESSDGVKERAIVDGAIEAFVAYAGWLTVAPGEPASQTPIREIHLAK